MSAPPYPDPFERFDLFQECLFTMMRHVSQEGYSAGWLQDLEYDLWKIVEEGPQEFGFHWIGPDRIAKLRKLSELAEGWIVYEDVPTWIPMPLWLERYRTWKSNLSA